MAEWIDSDIRQGETRTKGHATADVIGALALALALRLSCLALAEKPCEVRYPSDVRVSWDCRVLGRGETVERLFWDRWIDALRFNRIDRLHAGTLPTRPSTPPPPPPPTTTKE